MNKILKRILYVFLGIVILFMIAYPKLNLSKENRENTRSPKSFVRPILRVKGHKVNFQPIDFTVRVTGTIIADESVDLNSEVSAKVDGILFNEGEEVEKGQLLMTLNDDELEAELEKLKFTKKLNEDNEFRQKKLIESEAISREEYEIALTTLNTSLADIKLTEVRRSKYNIYAPFDGKIGLRQISIGSYINPGQLIARIYRIDPVKIDFSIPGRYLNDIDIGDKLKFTVEAYKTPFEGEIYAMEPQIDPQSRNIKLRAVCPNPDEKLLPGQFAKINLILDRIEQAVMIPNISVIPELNATKIYVYESGKVSSRIVITGIRTEDQIQVVEGLEPGDTVITSGLLQIRQGMKVNIEI